MSNEDDLADLYRRMRETKPNPRPLAPLMCQCRQCLRDRKEGTDLGRGFFVPAEQLRMILCPKCWNKRCPHATDHRHACTGSNEPGQAGSAYEVLTVSAGTPPPPDWVKEEDC